MRSVIKMLDKICKILIAVAIGASVYQYLHMQYIKRNDSIQGFEPPPNNPRPRCKNRECRDGGSRLVKN